jgi:acyl-CoA reductase-like NAD-dependent aldehyde dehydrogenase
MLKLLNFFLKINIIEWLEIIIIFLIIYYIYNYFKNEYRNIPTFSFEVPKPKGGKFKGDIKDALNSNHIICYNPANLEILGEVPVMNKEDVLLKIQKAKEAQKQWMKTSFSERRKVLRTLLNYIVTHQSEISNISILETGKTAIDSAFGEIFITCEKIKYILQNGEKYLKTEYRYPGMLMLHKIASIEYIPYGIIGIIIPWNFPIHNALSHIVTALFAGNAAIIKVSEWASWSYLYLERLMNSLLKVTGHNPNLVQFVTGYGETGSTLVQSVNKVLFIGSPEIGKKVMQTAAQSLIPVTLELGGKDPFIICEDADLDYTVKMALRGAFLNCGQNCVSAERFYVYNEIYDKFIEEVKKTMPKIVQGVGAPDVGAINMPSQLKKYIDFIEDAISKGAIILWGGKINENYEGHFFEPTVLINVNHSMKIMKEEMFGPIMSIMKVSSDEEVIKLANDSFYGLGCSVFSKNYQRAYNLAKNIEAGCTVINDWGLSMMIQSLPFGGVKISGFGKFNGPEGIRDFTYQKTYVTDRFGISFPPPKALFYPSSPHVHTLVEEFVTILYSQSIFSKIRAIGKLIKKIIKKDF